MKSHLKATGLHVARDWARAAWNGWAGVCASTRRENQQPHSARGPGAAAVSGERKTRALGLGCSISLMRRASAHFFSENRRGKSTERERSRAPQGTRTSPLAVGYQAPARHSFLPVAAAAGESPLPSAARASEVCCLGQQQKLRSTGGRMRGLPGGSKESTGRIRARRHAVKG